MDGDGPAHGSFAPVGLTNRRPPIERWAVTAIVILVVLVAKPWQSAEDHVGAGPTAPPRATVQPTVTAASDGLDDSAARSVAAFCLSTRSWLLASVERTVGHAGDQRIHVWRVLEPAPAADGPDDPTIPTVSIVSEGLIELGWCAPTSGDERPSVPVSMTTWVRTPTADQAVRITLDSSRPKSDTTPYGAIYRPPGKGPSSKATAWPNGTYIFRYREADDRQRWFAIDVETRALASPAP
jgi:hypothetical protein